MGEHTAHSPPVAGNTTKLVVIRGSSGSGKTTIAKALRERMREPIALVERDYFQRTVLNQTDAGTHPETAALVDEVVRFSLSHGFHVVLDGIMNTLTYGPTLERLYIDYPDRVTFFAFDLEFEETLRRHSTRSLASEFGETEMRQWFRGWQPLGFLGEERITKTESVEQIVERIAVASGLPLT